MRYVTWIALVLACSAHAIENLDSDFAAGPARVIEIAPGHTITLEPGQVLINGHLHTARSLKWRDQIHYGVRDEMIGRRIFDVDKDGSFGLARGDRLYILDAPRSRVLSIVEYDRATDPVVYTTGGEPQVMHVTRPIFRLLGAEGPVELANDDVHRLFRERSQVSVVRSVSEDTFRQMRERYLPLIRAFESHQTNEDRFVPLTPTETLELAHFERAEAGRFTYAMPGETMPALNLGGGYVQPAMKVWELILGIYKPDGGTRRLNKRETMIFISGTDEILMKYRLEQEKIILYEPYDAFEHHLCSILMSVDRAVIVTSK